MTTLQTAGEAMEALQVLNDRVALLVAENEKLRKDAERYRWIRECDKVAASHNGGVCMPMYTMTEKHKLELDKAIDAAIAK